MQKLWLMVDEEYHAFQKYKRKTAHIDLMSYWCNNIIINKTASIKQKIAGQKAEEWHLSWNIQNVGSF